MIIKDNTRERIRQVILFLTICLAFSVPFGDIYAEKILIIMSIFWIFFITLEDIKKLFTNKIIIILFAFIFSHFLTLFWSEHINDGLHEISRMWRYLFVPLIIYTSIIKKGEIKYIIGAFIFTMFINEIISYLIYFDLYQTEFSRTRSYPVGFINHIQYSVLVAFCAILILYQSKNLKNIYLKFIYIIFFITMTTNLVISSGRTGYVVYFGSLLILLFTYYKFTLKNFLQILLFPTLVFYIGYKYNSEVQAKFNTSIESLKKMQNSKNYNSSIGARIAFYPITYDMLKQKENSFIYGVGMGDLIYELEDSINRTKLINNILPHLHSSYLTAYVNAGILGLLLLVFLFYSLFKLKIEDKELKFIQYLFLLNFSIGIIPDILLTQKVTMVYFSLFVGVILAQYNIENTKRVKI